MPSNGGGLDLLLNRFGMGRLLARVGTSQHAHRFLSKGVLFFVLRYYILHRATRDADLLGRGSADESDLIASCCDIAAVDLGDGILIDPESVKAEVIREDNNSHGYWRRRSSWNT
ncbi:nucleotidyl transferase AbiEii/AbiGii toxin family protein [Acidovorax soli]|nr:nucleotidyl transferase AbiEii/AbiGii toxin family protein [Acidovorax soli]